MKPSAYSQHYDRLRAWLKTKRAEEGLSLRAMAELLGRHHSVVGKMEQDRRRIDIIEYVEYCQALDIDPHEGLDIILASIEQGRRRRG